MSSRIAETIPEFNTYINNTAAYLVAGSPTTNRERLGLSTQNGTDWTDQRTYWHDTLFPKYSDPLQSTSAVKHQVQNFMSGFHTFGNPLLNIMAASPNATEADESVFNFKIGRHEPTHSSTPIADSVSFEGKPIGGGDIHFICRVSSDSSRASKADGSDSVQLSFSIQGSDSNPNPDPGPPAADSKGMILFISTKCNFTLHLGDSNKTKILVVYMRWFNTKHPELAGPWSALQAIVIA